MKNTQNLPTLGELGFEQLYEDRILVKLESAETKSKGGIILAVPKDEEKQKIGIVIGSGPGEFDHSREKVIRPVEVKRGDRVMFGKYEGSELSLMGEPYYIIRQLGLIGKMKPLPKEPMVD
jgi:chaperonin GroES